VNETAIGPATGPAEGDDGIPGPDPTLARALASPRRFMHATAAARNSGRSPAHTIRLTLITTTSCRLSGMQHNTVVPAEATSAS
jgi:hypothetical protein